MQNSLANNLRSKQKSDQLNDIIKDIIKYKKLRTRRIASTVLFAAGLGISLFAPTSQNALNIVTALERYQSGGILLCVAPLLGYLYLIEKAVTRHIATHRHISAYDCGLMVLPLIFIAAIDINLLPLNYGLANILSCSLASVIMWPTKRRRRYYKKKHIDKRTK